MSISVLLVDDHALFREGIRLLLEEESNIAIVGEAADGRAAIRMAPRLKPQVVIMDVSMEGLNGVDATRAIVAQSPASRVLGLSMHLNVRIVSAMLRAGAAGYIPKECATDELVQAICVLARGQVYISPSVAGALVHDYIRTEAESKNSARDRLSTRELEVLQLISEGRNMREIADMLSVSVKTAHTHRDHVMHKLGLYSIAQLTKYAVREGLTAL